MPRRLNEAQLQILRFLISRQFIDGGWVNFRQICAGLDLDPDKAGTISLIYPALDVLGKEQVAESRLVPGEGTPYERLEWRAVREEIHRRPKLLEPKERLLRIRRFRLRLGPSPN